MCCGYQLASITESPGMLGASDLVYESQETSRNHRSCGQVTGIPGAWWILRNLQSIIYSVTFRAWVGMWAGHGLVSLQDGGRHRSVREGGLLKVSLAYSFDQRELKLALFLEQGPRGPLQWSGSALLSGLWSGKEQDPGSCSGWQGYSEDSEMWVFIKDLKTSKASRAVAMHIARCLLYC